MHRKITAATAAILLTLAVASSAHAQGYPTVTQADQFAAQNNIHGQCGQGLKWICAHPEFPWFIYCDAKRGFHSRDCYPVEWEVHDILGNYAAGSGHYWVRLESNYALSFHVDWGPRIS